MKGRTRPRESVEQSSRLLSDEMGFAFKKGLEMFEGLAAAMQLVAISFAPDKKSGQAVWL